ncbi:MAG: hypothetical protein JSS30_03470 [Verrucomicrobia bacterium]|nr:hypothetical protein [Verrucomicrobiota bacterium]
MIEQAMILIPLLIGAYMTISLLKFPDFSIESAYLFGAVSAVLAGSLPLPLILLTALLGGMVVGGTVSVLNQCFKFPFLLAAIITNGLFHGLTQMLLGTSVKSFHPTLMISEIGLFVIIACSLIAILGFCLRSQLGYSLAIYGQNPKFFHHHPPSGRYVATTGVIVGHGCAGIGGFLFALSNGFVDLTMNFGIVLLCLTALIFGKALFPKSRPNIFVPLVGLLAYFCIQQLLLHLGLNLKYFYAFQALFVLGTLYFMHRKKNVTLDHMGV